MIQSDLCGLLGIKYPVFQGGMAHISDACLAGAVSEAGGLGIISAAGGNVAQISAEIDKIRTITDKPFGVNVMLRGQNIDEIAELLCEAGFEIMDIYDYETEQQGDENCEKVLFCCKKKK